MLKSEEKLKIYAWL